MKTGTPSPSPSPSAFQKAIQGQLNAEQEAAAFAPEGPLLIIAGAGSGKTRTLTYRVAHLVHSGLSVDRILLCTFTNKAAKEMIHRVESLLQRPLEGMWAGTFHHIANRTLRRHADRLGFSSRFTILDRDDTALLIDQTIAGAGYNDEHPRFPKGRALCEIFGLSVSLGLSIGSVIQRYHPRFCPIADEIDTIFSRFQEKKLAMDLMDFDDLLFFWHQLLSRFHDLRDLYADTFLHVLVDEYQDTNPLQADIIHLLTSKHRRLTVVGDDAQSIYSFRGADTEHILQFPHAYKASSILYLTDNYRSRPAILDLSHRVIAHNPRQFDKTLRATRPDGETPALWIAPDSRTEAALVVEGIQHLHSSGLPYDEIAVLYRIHAHSLEIQIALQKARIPFVIRSGLRIVEQAHVKDVLSFLRVLSNPRDQLAWTRLLPLFKGLGKETLKKVWKHLEKHDFSIHCLRFDQTTKLLPKKPATILDWLGRLLEEGLEIAQRETPGQILRKFIEQEYQEYLASAYDNAIKRAEDLRQVAAMADTYPTLQAFLDEIVLVSDPVSALEGSSPSSERGVVLSTVHQAKGLEWGAVFLLNLSEGAFPFFLAQEDDEIEEERRLFYVALTRAKDHLVLLYRREAQKSSYREAYTLPPPSRFLLDLFLSPDPEEPRPPATLATLLALAQNQPLLRLGDRS